VPVLLAQWEAAILKDALIRQLVLAFSLVGCRSTVVNDSRLILADTRTVDELLSFIDGEKNKSAAASEAKREKRKAKRQQKKSTAQSPQPDEDAHEQPLAQRGDASSNQNCGQASAHMPSEPIGSTSSRVRLKNGGSQSDHFNDKLSVMAQEVCACGRCPNWIPCHVAINAMNISFRKMV
jgi:flagellum-specific peptidoglycan hydrolase FlgJ